MTWGRVLTGTRNPSVILGGSGALEQLPERAAQVRASGGRFFVVTDHNVRAAWGRRVLELLGSDIPSQDVLSLPAGEASKSVSTLAGCWDWLAAGAARRNDVVVALGGGVVGDLAGFAAATYLRGMPLWQIPTSLLAQVDSSVGGKTAVNIDSGKNLVGAFYQPELVLVDPSLLCTLPEEEFVGGLGEVVKYGLLQGEDLFSILEQESSAILEREQEVLGDIVRRCVMYKADVVDEDELDKGRRAVLNLGHTAGHALERTFGYGGLAHGRAVALGLLVALALSEETLGLGLEVSERTRRLLSAFGLPVSIDLPAIDSILAAASRDKKITAGTSGFVGLAAVGAPVWGVDVTETRLAAALEVIGK